MRANEGGKGTFLFYSLSALFFLSFSPTHCILSKCGVKPTKETENRYPNHSGSTSLAGLLEHRLCLKSFAHEYLSQHLRQMFHFLTCFSFLTSSLNISFCGPPRNMIRVSSNRRSRKSKPAQLSSLFIPEKLVLFFI